MGDTGLFLIIWVGGLVLIWVMTPSASEVRKNSKVLSQVIEDLKESEIREKEAAVELAWHKQVTREWFRGIKILIAQLTDVGIVPAWQPPVELEEWIEGENVAQQHRWNAKCQQKLTDLIEGSFDLNEMDSLLFDLDLNRDNFASRTLKGLVLEMVLYCVRRDMMSDLIKNLKALRPHLDWECK